MDRVTFLARWLRHQNRFKNENDHHLVPISCQLQNWLFIFPPSLCQWVFLLFDKSDEVWGNQKRKNALRASSSSVHFQIGHKECANFNPMVIVNGWFCCSIKFSDIKNVKACRPLPLASCFCQFPNLSQGPCKECVIFRPTSVGGSAVWRNFQKSRAGTKSQWWTCILFCYIISSLAPRTA